MLALVLLVVQPESFYHEKVCAPADPSRDHVPSSWPQAFQGGASLSQQAVSPSAKSQGSSVSLPNCTGTQDNSL
jgi:hypothetical protein